MKDDLDDLDSFMAQRQRQASPPDPLVDAKGKTKNGTSLHRLESVIRSSPNPANPDFRLVGSAAPLAGDMDDCLAVCDPEDPAVATLTVEVRSAIRSNHSMPGVPVSIRQGTLLDIIRLTRKNAAAALAAA